MFLACETADGIEETLQLRLGVMEATGTRPTIGAAEDRGTSIRFANTREFGGNERQRLIPG